MNFRAATLDDVPKLAAARWAFRTEGNGELPIEAEQAFAHRYESFVRSALASHRWRGYATDCYTYPPFRNRGIGRELLARVTAWAKSQDVEMLVVWASDDSQRFCAC